MAAQRIYLAVDLGASSGRVLAGKFDGHRLELEELHRFVNGPVEMAGTLYWDLPRLWSDICDGLSNAGAQFGDSVVSIGVDTWGVDFGLLDANDQLLGNPVHYRDARTRGVMDKILARVSREEIFSQTGLQFMELNTLYQLAAMRDAKSPQLDMAQSLLMIPDLIHWLLTGQQSNEFTNATTTQFFNSAQRHWSTELLERLDLPTHFLNEIAMPGTNLGHPRSNLASELRLAKADVILPGTHDTASAVMAVPSQAAISLQPDWCYISSGTWSLMGVEVPEPIINETCRELNFTNEGGVENTVRLLRNIAGLWIVQECRRIWGQEGVNYDWEQLVQLAEASPELSSFIDAEDASFGAPTDMPAAIRTFCRKTGQTEPESPGAVIRCALESLALRYRVVLDRIEQLTQATIRTVHVVGGGTQNKLLCQMTADACGREVVVGPVEATAIGNLMMQAVAVGDVGSVAEARRVIRESFRVSVYQPSGDGDWDSALGRFRTLTEPLDRTE